MPDSNTNPDSNADPTPDLSDAFTRPEDVQLLVLDVDGVLTDGSINLHDDGSETKRFSVRDGLGIKLWLDAGFPLAIITARAGDALMHRVRSLGIDENLVIQGSKNKSEALDVIVAKTGIALKQTAYMGDDWPDLPALRRVGFPMTVADAEPEVLDAAGYVTERIGGHGAVRQAIAMILVAKDLYTPPR
ncbi:MAG: HAD hydrolase family protein [Phycisphaerales bacterium]|nr:HAD hydrolase family protein [Phycisphaerales bacterium]